MVIAVLLLAAQAGAAPAVPPVEPAPRVAASAKPIVDPTSWITPDDYPVSALRAHEEGRVTIKFTVATSGLVTACTVIISSGSAALDQASCSAVQRRARFTPAQDEHGRPIAITMSRTFKWTIPVDSPDLEVVGPTRTHVDLSNGRVSRCTNATPVAHRVTADRDACAIFGSSDFVRQLLGADLTRAKAVDVSIQIVPGDPMRPPPSRGTSRIVLAEALVTIDSANGRELRCVTRVANVLPSYSVDFCSSLAIDPGATPTGTEVTLAFRTDATVAF